MDDGGEGETSSNNGNHDKVRAAARQGSSVPPSAAAEAENNPNSSPVPPPPVGHAAVREHEILRLSTMSYQEPGMNQSTVVPEPGDRLVYEDEYSGTRPAESERMPTSSSLPDRFLFAGGALHEEPQQGSSLFLLGGTRAGQQQQDVAHHLSAIAAARARDHNVQFQQMEMLRRELLQRQLVVQQHDQRQQQEVERQRQLLLAASQLQHQQGGGGGSAAAAAGRAATTSATTSPLLLTGRTPAEEQQRLALIRAIMGHPPLPPPRPPPPPIPLPSSSLLLQQQLLATRTAATRPPPNLAALSQDYAAMLLGARAGVPLSAPPEVQHQQQSLASQGEGEVEQEEDSKPSAVTTSHHPFPLSSSWAQHHHPHAHHQQHQKEGQFFSSFSPAMANDIASRNHQHNQASPVAEDPASNKLLQLYRARHAAALSDPVAEGERKKYHDEHSTGLKSPPFASSAAPSASLSHWSSQVPSGDSSCGGAISDASSSSHTSRKRQRSIKMMPSSSATIAGGVEGKDALTERSRGESSSGSTGTAPPNNKRSTSNSSGTFEGAPEEGENALPEPRGYRRKKKTSDHPTRPLSAYNLFFRDQRTKLLLERQRKQRQAELEQVASQRAGKEPQTTIPPKIDFSTMTKHVAARWKEADDETRSRFQGLADEDLRRYRSEMTVFQAKEREARERSLQELEDTVDEETRSKYLSSHSSNNKKEG